MLAIRLVRLHADNLISHETETTDIPGIEYEKILNLNKMFVSANILFPKEYIDKFIAHDEADGLVNIIFTLIKYDKSLCTEGKINCDLTPFFLIKSPKLYSRIMMLLRNNYLLNYSNVIRLIKYEDILEKVKWDSVSLNTFLNQANIDVLINIADGISEDFSLNSRNVALQITRYLQKQLSFYRDEIFMFRFLCKKEGNVNILNKQVISHVAIKMSEIYPVLLSDKKNINNEILKSIRSMKALAPNKLDYSKSLMGLRALEQYANYIDTSSQISLKKLTLLCWAAIHDNSMYHGIKYNREKLLGSFIKALAEIKIKKIKKGKVKLNHCDSAGLFTNLVVLMVKLFPNIATIVRDKHFELAKEKLQTLFIKLYQVCKTNPNFSFKEGLELIYDAIYREFHIEKEKYLPNTGIFPNGRSQLIDFCNTMDDIILPEFNLHQSKDKLILEDIDESIFSDEETRSSMVNEKFSTEISPDLSNSKSQFNSVFYSPRVYPNPISLNNFFQSCKIAADDSSSKEHVDLVSMVSYAV